MFLGAKVRKKSEKTFPTKKEFQKKKQYNS